MVMRPVLLRYGVAGLAVGLALVLQLLLVPWFGAGPDANLFLLFFAALIVAAWSGGLGPGLVAHVLSALTRATTSSSIRNIRSRPSASGKACAWRFSLSRECLSAVCWALPTRSGDEPKRLNVASSSFRSAWYSPWDSWILSKPPEIWVSFGWW